MLADSDTALIITAVGIAVPATIAAVCSGIAMLRAGKTQTGIQEIAPKVIAIDRAVNGQPAEAATMVDNVKGIKAEQVRVADELRDSQ